MKAQESIDKKTLLSLLDIAGSCFVDIIYNHLYDRAISIHEKTSKGLTGCYRQTIKDYVDESNTPKFYSVLLNSIHHYTRMTTIYDNLSYSDCISLYACLFVPHMYINSMTLEQKVNIVSMIFGNVINEFVDEILKSHISIIIDDHSDPINIEILQDSILKILLSERDISYDKFIESQKEGKSKKKTEKKVKIVNKPNLQTKAMLKITEAFKKSITERSSLKKKNSHLQQKNKQLSNSLKEMKSMFLEQIAHQKEQATLIDQLKSQLEKTVESKSITSPLSHSLNESNYYADDDELFSVTYVEN